jgi:hypothetical protein
MGSANDSCCFERRVCSQNDGRQNNCFTEGNQGERRVVDCKLWTVGCRRRCRQVLGVRL